MATTAAAQTTALTTLRASAGPGPAAPEEGGPTVSSSTVIAARDQRPLGQILLEDGAVESGNLLKAAMIRQRQASRLGEVLLANGWVQPEALTRALSRQWRSSVIDLAAMPPDPRLIDQLGADFCLSEGLVPWRRIGGVTYIVTARPEDFDRLRPGFPAGFGTVRMLLSSDADVLEAVLKRRQTALIRQAETRVPAHESCRTRNEVRVARVAMVLGLAVTLGLIFAPIAMIALLTFWAVLTLLASSALKLLSFCAVLRARKRARMQELALAKGRATPPEMTAPLPVISVMVPLFGEANIADRLIGRLGRLNYPHELMDILIVVEETDQITCEALAAATLPRWMRIVRVPDGPIRTKPRALNYALNFCRGDIIGVWDAEDRPEPEQLHKVARRFHFAPPEVACLQGVLDFYNPRTNWLARAFTIEYASWFRATLAGAAALNLVVPLGGTTLFFRRKALEEVGCWDAWNVTEDADLGVRLVRRGYRTEMLDTVTHEEANCRALPWIKQRSRWHKGFAMTWGVHMRNPLRLWQDLGPRRFLGFQAQFLASLSQYLLAPVLWSFWLLIFGLPHPMRDMLSGGLGGNAIALLFTLFILSEILNITVGLWAVRGKDHRHLMPWVPTLHLYFPLGCLAGWKAIYEVVAKPFYWDKTAHGIFDIATEEEEIPTAAPQAAKPPPLIELFPAPASGPSVIAPAFEDSGLLPVLGKVN
ncbi:glycosyltransferase family 2 protein [Paracoccus sulfuroxidans]|uniref:glycosyltransferase family 2 protein n=1 Tax=Paracoccus sulfuroxidans TaxID=384678 RepID=UPI0011A69CC0